MPGPHMLRTIPPALTSSNSQTQRARIRRIAGLTASTPRGKPEAYPESHIRSRPLQHQKNGKTVRSVRLESADMRQNGMALGKTSPRAEPAVRILLIFRPQKAAAQIPNPSETNPPSASILRKY
jgi:hypothetical protein